MESNELKLMVGDWVERLCREKIKVTPDYLVYIENYPDRSPQPIPLTPDILERIGMRYDGTYWDNDDISIPVVRKKDGSDILMMPNGKYANGIEHLHTLQQLIRLFTGKEIVVKWEK